MDHAPNHKSQCRDDVVPALESQSKGSYNQGKGIVGKGITPTRTRPAGPRRRPGTPGPSTGSVCCRSTPGLCTAARRHRGPCLRPRTRSWPRATSSARSSIPTSGRPLSTGRPHPSSILVQRRRPRRSARRRGGLYAGLPRDAAVAVALVGVLCESDIGLFMFFFLLVFV